MRLVSASANPDKAAEMAAVLAGVDPPVELAPRPAGIPDVVEDGATLLDNARLKARAVLAATGEAAVADDTGLEVDALGGAPGVFSARYAGEEASYADNVARLLSDLEGVPAERRTARFRTVTLVAFPDGGEVVAEGVLEGVITASPRGAGGFGYDPVFVPAPDDSAGEAGESGGAGEAGIGRRTLAELAAVDPSAKHRISHRGRALRALAARLAVERA